MTGKVDGRLIGRSVDRTLTTTLLVAAVLLAGCSLSGASLASSSSPSASAGTAASRGSSASVAPSPSAARIATPTPVCADRASPSWVTEASNPKDGVQDPAGRIYFGLVERSDDILGQIVAPLFAIDPDGSDLVQILDCQIERPRVSPDGTRLAFSIVMSDGTWQIATSAVDGRNLRVLTSMAGSAETPDWSPDGSWLTYSYSQNRCAVPTCVEDGTFRPTLWRMDADGSHPRILGDPDFLDSEARLSPDGREVVFDRWDASRQLQAFMIRDLATGAERRVTTTNTGDIEHPDWTRDGRSIIYNTNNDSSGTYLELIQTVPAKDPAAKPRTLYGDAEHAGFKAAYSPDGKRIVFGCDQDLCLMNADGTKVVDLWGVSGSELNHFAWGVTPIAVP